MTAAEALEALDAVLRQVEATARRLATAGQFAGDASDTMAESFRGSTNPRTETAQRSVAEAGERLSEALRRLEVCEGDLRAYASEAFGHALGGNYTPTSGWSAAELGGAEDLSQPPRPLGEAFKPAVYVPDGAFQPDERSIADRLVEAGASVHARRADHTVHRKKNPDTLVRWSPGDPGTITEFKTANPKRTKPDRAVQRDILDAAEQLSPYTGGDAVIDVRGTTITADQARHGYRRALGQSRQQGTPLPRRVFVILSGGEIIDVAEARRQRGHH